MLRKLKGEIEEVSNLLNILTHSEAQHRSKMLVYEERRHFEDLFNARISVHLVFSTLLLYVVYRSVDPTLDFTILDIWDLSIQRILLIVGTVVSAALTQAVHRTYRFVNLALEDIENNWEHDPYPVYKGRVCLWNATLSLLVVSYVLSFLFLFLAIFGVSEVCAVAI